MTKDLAKMSARELRREVQELREGPCRFNCRTQRDAFLAGFDAGAADAADSGIIICEDYKRKVIDRAYRDWKRGRAIGDTHKIVVERLGPLCSGKCRSRR